MTKKAKKKQGFKQWVGRVHLWLGLASGLIVLLLGITGCLYAFAEEIKGCLRKDQLYVKEVKDTRLPPSALWQIAQQAIGKDKPLNAINLYSDPQKATSFYAYAGTDGNFFYFDNVTHYVSVYIDPYTGKVLGVYDEEMDFFNIIKMLHWSLLISHPVGQQIVGWGTMAFVVMLISGIILWWPKNKAARKQRLWFRWKDATKWRRKNYDLHNIFGFYVATVALILAFTGMVWAFSWFKSAVYVAGSLSTTPPKTIVEKSVVSNGDKDMAFNKAAAIAWQKHPDAGSISLAYPAEAEGIIDLYVQQHDGAYYVNHNMQFDQYSGKLLRERHHSEKNFGEKLITANYDIHVGAILGLPGKILAFIASFICAMLPVTGFLIWWGRTNKKASKKSK